jgi:hypothetical protein
VDGSEFGHELMVRARHAGDLDRLRAGSLPSLGPTVELPGRDYPVRAFTTRRAFADALAEMALALDYGNFKHAVAERHSPARAHVYAKVWADCLEIEREGSG